MAKRKYPLPDQVYELDEQTALADAGEAAAVFLHELGNILNNILLDTKLSRKNLPKEQHDRLQTTCDLVSEASRQMRVLAQYTQQCRSEPYRIELRLLLRELVSAIDVDKKIAFHLPDEDLMAWGTLSDAKRIFRLLLNEALAETPTPGRVRITSTQHEDGVEIKVEHDGRRFDEDEIRVQFEPFLAGQDASDSVRLPIAKSLARRMRGKLDVAARPNGGRIFSIRLPNK